MAALDRYRETVTPPRRRRDVAYDVKDVVGTGGFGIGSAGLPAYNVLLEGYDQALENDVVLSIKQGNVAAPSRIVDGPGDRRDYFEHHGHRTAVSQRALQANASQFLGHTEIDGVGFVVAELSPYELDLDWEDLTEPDEIRPVMVQLGQATAKLHCVGDADSDHTLVPFQTEEAITAMIGDRREEFVADLVRVRPRLRPADPGRPPPVRRRLPRRGDPGDQPERGPPAGLTSITMPTCGPMPGLSNSSVTTVKPIRS